MSQHSEAEDQQVQGVEASEQAAAEPQVAAEAAPQAEASGVATSGEEALFLDVGDSEGELVEIEAPASVAATAALESELATLRLTLEQAQAELTAAREAQGAFVSRADGSWLVDGSAAMEEVQTHFGMDGLPEEEAGAYHTIGGFVMARLGRVPKAADHFEWGGMKFEVMDMDGRRIDKVLVSRTHAPAARGEQTE